MKTIVIAAAVALAAGVGSATAAEPLINKDGMTGPEVAAWLQSEGFQAELTKDKTGDPLIKSAAGGQKFSVYFYDCKDARCKALQFSIGYDMTDGMPLAKVNEWNKGHRYLKAYLDDENDPYVQYDVNVNAGRTIAGLNDDFGVWTGMIGDFKTFIGW